MRLRINGTGHIYVPRRLGPVDVLWRAAGDELSIRVIPNPGGPYRQYVHALPRPWLGAAARGRARGPIPVDFEEDGRGWLGRLKLMGGWRAAYARFL
jgi:hypothetical protein